MIEPTYRTRASLASSVQMYTLARVCQSTFGPGNKGRGAGDFGLPQLFRPAALLDHRDLGFQRALGFGIGQITVARRSADR